MQGLDLRDAVKGITRHASIDLSALWRQVTDAAQAQEALHDILPALIDTYGVAAATLAADWYDQAREKAGIRGRFTATPSDIADTGAHALVGWALKEATDYPAFQTLIEGGIERRIANFSRLTVTSSSVADPEARGWQRVGTGECGFCAILIGRGAVYTQETADFAAHDHCHCSATPAWNGLPVPVKPYVPTNRNVTAADRARVREYLRTH